MICTRCHRPLRHASPTGMGPVCTKRAGTQAPQPHERDLFGYDIASAAQAAHERVRVAIEVATAEALMAIRHGFAAERRRLGVWS
jgi:hypothetical protein